MLRPTRQKQMSEAFILSAFLAFSGGFQDAYTYIVRDQVFANAQTGNVVLMSTLLMQGEWGKALHYFLTIVSFVLGVFVAAQTERMFREARILHWRQGILVLEMVILALVGLFPLRYNVFANMLVSFSCAMQVQTFRTVAGNPYASTMCIGNLRSGTAAFSSWLTTRSAKDREKVLHYFGVIFFFAIGAGIGGNICKGMGVRSIWISDLFLLIAFLLMEIDRERKTGGNA